MRSMLAGLWILSAGMAVGDPATGASRLAIVSDAGDGNLAALVTTELSATSGVVLLERDDLAKIGDEMKVQQLASTDPIALGKLAGADGLIFLDQRPDGTHVRLTAVNLGYALFDEVLPRGMDLTQEAKTIGHLAAIDSGKLKLEPTKAVPISILNLRSEVTTSDSTKIERNLTLLLESRLSSVPEFVVLERRHAWNLGFEHSLDAAAAPLLEGAYVLDGTLQIQGEDGGALTVQLRLRDPVSKQKKQFEVAGKTSDLPGFVEAMTKQIVQTVGTHASSSAWAPQAEAREYLREGIWAWQHEQPQAALEALDSAELLGETAPDLLAARIQVLGQFAAPDLEPSLAQFVNDPGAMPMVFQHANPGHVYAPVLPLADRLALVRRQMTDLAVYQDPAGLRSYHLQFLDPKWQHIVQQDYARAFVIYAGSRVLADLNQQHDPQADTFREEVRRLANFDPLHGKLPIDTGDGAFFADDWAHSLDEEEAYYRQVLSAPGVENQSRAVFLKDRFICERGLIFCPRFIPNPDEQRKALVQFAQSLEQIPEGKLGGLLILSGSMDKSLSESSYSAFLDELYNQRVQLVASGELFPHCLPAYTLYQRNDSLQAKFGDHAVPILRYFLTTSSQWDIRTLQVLWVPSGFAPADAPAIWNELKAYKARIFAPNSPEAGYAFQENAMFGAFESAFATAFPNLIETPKDSLAVTRFWQPALTSGTPFFMPRFCAVSGKTVAIEGETADRQKLLYLLHPPDFETAPTELPGGIFGFGFSMTPDDVYVTGYARDSNNASDELHWKIARYNLNRQEWDQHDISFGFSTPWAVHDRLFLTIASGNGGHGAIALYDWTSQAMTLLSSDRRRPAQNQFDDRNGYQVLSLFSGLHNTIGTNIDFKCFTVSENPGNWPEIIPGFDAQRAYLMHDKTLLEDYQNRICVLIDPSKQQPEILLQAPESTTPPALTSLGAPRWHLDSTTILKIFDSPKAHRGDSFFALVRHQTVPMHYELLWFVAGDAEPVPIPLQFKMDSVAQLLMKNMKGQPVNTVSAIDPALEPFPLDMVASDAGICLFTPVSGLWFIPYADIDGYIQKIK
jgi:hypothetical protein